MPYQIDIQCEKSVDKWSDENGAEGKSRGVDAWGYNIDIPELTPEEVKRGISIALARYGVQVEEVREFTGEAGRFTVCRVEDGNGAEDKDGTWIADYDVYVMVRKVEQYKPLDLSLGFDKV